MRKFIFAVVLVAAIAGGCGPKRINFGNLSEKRHLISPEELKKHGHVPDGQSDTNIKKIVKLNRVLGRPIFGVVGGYYQLPKMLSGLRLEANIIETYGMSLQSYRISEDGPAVGVVPVRRPDAFRHAMEGLLEAGVRIAHMPMADAAALIKAEGAAKEGKRLQVLSKHIKPGVDLLISIQRGDSEQGSVVLGRVISTRTGRFYAVAMVPYYHADAYRVLMTTLVEKTLVNMQKDAQEKAKK